MKVSVTQFRKDLFRLVEQALNGEYIEVEHKGRTLQLVPKARASKLSRLVKRDILTCTPEEFEKSATELGRDLQRQWEEKWTARLK